MNEPKILRSIKTGEKTEIRLIRDWYDKSEWIGLRRWFLDSNNEWKPTTKGINLKLKDAKELLEGLKFKE